MSALLTAEPTAASEPASERASSLVKPEGVVLLTQDVVTPAARTSEAIAGALRRAGIRTYVRDTALIRWMHDRLGDAPERKRDGWNLLTASKLKILVELGKCDTILGLDLYWMLSNDPFLEHPRVRQVVSLWYDDLRTCCVQLGGLGGRVDDFQARLRHAKVHHSFYGRRQCAEARSFGLERVTRSPLAAPAEYLALRKVPEPSRRRRLAFVGGPGGRTPPSREALVLMQARAEVRDLRVASLRETLEDPAVAQWSRGEPTVRPWLQAAMEAKLEAPSTPAVEHLLAAGSSYPRALAYLEEKGEMLDAALLVKLVLRYDRPALVHRLHSRGLVDVYSAPWFWKPFGIESAPTVRFPDLPALYQSYAAHLNAGYSVREAVVNEKLFEIAACGRLSFNLSDDEIGEHFALGSEVEAHATFREIEESIRWYLGKPESLRESGERARERVRRCHTWDHRVAAVFGLPKSWESHP